MIKEILKKVKDASFSIFPIVCIIIVLFLLSLIPNVFPTINNEKLIETDTFLVFLLCSIFLLLGFVLFDIGAENALAKVGSYVGANISKRGNIIIIAFITILLGILIAIAEPDLSILSDQIGNSINPWVFKLAVGIGQGVYFFVAILRILFNKSCKHLYLFCYLIVFAIGCFYGPGKDASAFISLSFDTAGVSTGAATIPFVIAFGASFASTRGGKDQSSNSFGYAGLMSVGPVTIMLLMCLLIQNDVVLSNTQELQSVTQVLSDSLLEVFIDEVLLDDLIIELFLLETSLELFAELLIELDSSLETLFDEALLVDLIIEPFLLETSLELFTLLFTELDFTLDELLMLELLITLDDFNDELFKPLLLIKLDDLTLLELLFKLELAVLLCLLLEVVDEVDELSECGMTSVEFMYAGSSVTVT